MPLAFFNLGAPEAIVIGIVALLLFGPRLPAVMRSLGKGIVEFKKGIRDTEDEVNREIDSAATEPPKQIKHESEA
ncbi:twin-arginine translocase TatA/TatE family subunit [bacterium]|nr:twin-arginine translocase TatA/TatE family subunit [bacterium]